MTAENRQENTVSRWRLILGQEAEEALSGYSEGGGLALTEEELIMDAALAAIYDETGAGSSSGNAGTAKGKGAGTGRSAVHLSKWLGDVRNFSRKM